MIKLSFHQTRAEQMVRAAATVIFNELASRTESLAPLSEICHQPQYGFTASASFVPVGPKFVRITDLEHGHINWDSVPYCKCDNPESYLLRQDDLLFARTGATTGKTHIVGTNPEAIFASYLIRVRPKEGMVPRYLYSFFQSDGYWGQLIDEKKGSAQPNVNGKKLMTLLVPKVDKPTQISIAQFLEVVRMRGEGSTTALPELPSFLQKQRRIVARIEELSAKIEEAHSLRKQAAEEAEAIFQSALHSIWQNQSGWATAEIADLIKTVSGQVNPTVEPFAGMPHINGESMESNTGRLLNNYRLAKEDGVTSGKYHFGAGAVLYSKIRPYLRKAVIVPFEGICSADVYATESIAPQLDAQFFKYTLIGADFTAYANEKSGRTRMPKLNQKQLFSYRMTFPLLEEQGRIVAYLDDLQGKVDTVKKLQEESEQKLNALMPSILSKAFAGEL
jgi:type I restriction enzyme S subunit